MNIITVLGYVFNPVSTISTDDKSFKVLKIRYQQGKKNYLFCDVYITDGQAKYLSNIQKDDQLVVVGELNLSAYINKESQAQVKVSINAKSLKIINTQTKDKKEKEEEIQWF